VRYDEIGSFYKGGWAMTTKTAKKTAKPAVKSGVTPPAKSITGDSGPVAAKPLPKPAEASPGDMVALPGGHVGTLIALKGTKKGDAVKVEAMPMKAVRIVKGWNPRSATSAEDIAALASSIRAVGLLHSPIVRPAKGAPGTFDVVAGECRVRALHSLDRDTIPVLVRLDLEGDDDKAKAVALTENSDDLRHGLNAIEVGRVVSGLAKKGWSVEDTGKFCGLHSRKVRRCLDLMKAPEDVQKQVEAGTLAVNPALEIAKLDPETRKKIKSELTADITLARVKQLAKAAAEDAAEEAAPTAKGHTQLKGKARDAALVAWRGSREEQAAIARLAYTLKNAKNDMKGTAGYHEFRGALVFALWHRGDLHLYELPDPAEAENGKDKAAIQKHLTKFDALVEAEAAKHKPETEAEDK
jgi:ParB/RepB/Spo0J family partition protein